MDRWILLIVGQFLDYITYTTSGCILQGYPIDLKQYYPFFAVMLEGNQSTFPRRTLLCCEYLISIHLIRQPPYQPGMSVIVIRQDSETAMAVGNW